MKYLSFVLALCVMLTGAACSSKPKAKQLSPLALMEGGVKPQAIALTEQGTQAYQAKRFE
jgi:hypothetical protein